jgi:16S rRNA G966 N2-methylase RsmD
VGFDFAGVGLARTESASRVASQQLYIESADVGTGVVLESRSERSHSRAGEARQHPEAW